MKEKLLILIALVCIAIPNVSAKTRVLDESWQDDYRMILLEGEDLSDRGYSDSKEDTKTKASTNYCTDEFKKPLKFLGKIFGIVKILVPLVIIAFGIMDLFRAVVGSKDDEIKKSIKSLALRAVAGVVIFFIPTIVHMIFVLVDDWSNYETDYSNCSKCITEPNKC